MKRAMALREQLPGDEMLAEQPEDAGTVGPAPVESRKSPVSSQSAEPDARARLRDFVMSRLEAKPYELAPPSRMERLRETEDALAPGANDILAGVWGSIGKPVPGGGWATNAAAPMRSEREKARALLEARRQAQTATASTLLGREDALASDAQKRADEMKADEVARGDRLKRDESEMSLKRDQLAEEKRIHDAQIERDKQKLSRHGSKMDEGARLPSTTVEGLADTPTAISGIGDLAKKFEELGMDSMSAKLSNALAPGFVGDMLGTDVSKFRQAALVAMQGVGSIMENGKLAAGDEVKYTNMLPRPGMSREAARQAVANAQAFLLEKVRNRVKALRDAGYKVPAIKGVDDAAQSGAAPTAAATGAVAVAKVRVSNGKETFDIDAADLADAQHDGFQVVR